LAIEKERNVFNSNEPYKMPFIDEDSGSDPVNIESLLGI
jgi:hypothetical protein